MVTIVPSSQLGLPAAEVLRASYENAGGAMEEITELILLLKVVGLVAEVDGVLRRTSDGDRVAKAMRTQDRTPLALALIRAGVLHDQARHLIESGTTDPEGNLRCEPRIARAGAPQLLGMLQWWGDVEERPYVVIPKDLLAELNSVWALIPPRPDTPTWARERKEIGNRAEMYTVHIEKLRATDPSNIAWVARDTDTLGWDVEDRSRTTLRRIEVKGSRDREPLFYLSDNEWKKAKEHGEAYEIHFWGGIDLTKQPADEFSALRTLGFPIIVTRIIDRVARGEWSADAVRWRVYRSASPRIAKHDEIGCD